MQQVRVLQLISGIDLGGLSGGAEYFGVRLAQNLDPAQICSAVFALQLHPTATVEHVKAQLAKQKIAVFGQSAPIDELNVANLRLLYNQLRACVREFQPQIINSHSERCDLLNLLISRTQLPRIHSVQTVHVERQWITKPQFGTLFNQIVAPWAFDAHVVVSDYLRQQLLQRPLVRLLQSKVRLYYNAIDTKWFVGTNKEPIYTVLPLELPVNVPQIVVVGRLEEQKGHTYLLQALKMILQERPFELLIVGQGSLEEMLRREAEILDITPHVHFLGHRQDVAAILAQANLLVLPSLWEGFPTVLLEAMAQGTPVIATAVAGSRELVRHEETGLLVPPNNPTSLAQAILFMLTHPDKAQQMAVQATEFARQFTIDKTAAQYTALYQELTQSV